MENNDRFKTKIGVSLGGKSNDEDDLMETQEVVSVGSSQSKGGRAASVNSRSSSPPKRAKRVLESMSPSASDSVSVDGLNKMREVNEKLRKFLFTESNRVSKAVSEFVLNCVSECEGHMMRMIAKNERLLGRLDECEKQLQRMERVAPGASYASVAGSAGRVTAVKSGSKQAERVSSMKERTYAVVVRPKDESVKLTNEQVKERVLKGVSKDVNVRVNAVRKIRSGGLAIETATEEDLRVLKECGKFDVLGLKVESPKKIGPKLVVFDVDNKTPNDAFLHELYERNLRRLKVSEDEFRLRARVVTRTNRKGADVGNVVVELARGMHDALLKEGRVYIGWSACKVKDYVNVLRCHRCLAFGHVMKECSVKEKLCERCGESGHIKEKCKNACVCRNCRRRGRKADHMVTSRECPEYVRLAERERYRIFD